MTVRTKMTAAEQDDTLRIGEIVLEQCAACETAEETRDAALNFIHTGCATLVVVAGYDFTVDFMKKLTAILEREAEEKRTASMN